MATPIESTNPFPGADEPVWRQRLADALADYAGWPDNVCQDIAAFIVRPKDLLIRTGSTYRLRDGVVDIRTYESGVQHHILKARAHGFMGSPTEYNERVRSSFAAPAAPGATGAALPKLTTVTAEDGTPLGILTTTDPLNEEQLGELFDITGKSMVKANGKRPWDLPGDLMLHGQVEPSMHAVLIRQITDDDGDVIEVTDPMAIIGNNRTQARQACLGITSTQLGVSPTVAGWSPSATDAETHYYLPATWAPKLANTLRTAWEEIPEAEKSDEARQKAHDVARAAGKLATVPVEFVLTVTAGDNKAPIENFERVVWEPNRISHRRQPLQYDDLERSTAEVRALVSAYADAGLLDAAEAEWLAGDAPVLDKLIADSTGMTNADVRDLRDLRLLKVIFPSTAHGREIVQQTLGEPAPRFTQKAHVQQRHRLATAAITIGYAGEKWNEQINDGLLRASAIRDRWIPQDKSAGLLLRLARTDEGALEEFIVTRGLNWLASHQLIFADRGSIGEGKKTAGLVRRTPTNMRAALKRKPKAAIGLFQEIRRASGKFGEPERAPRQVDETGIPIKGTVADAHWFLEMFPKIVKRGKDGDPGPTRTKKTTKKELLEEARIAFVEAAHDDLATAMAGVFSAGEALAAAARAAGEPGFTAAQGSTTDLLSGVFNAVRQDSTTLLSMLVVLADTGPSLDHMECKSALLIDMQDEDDEDDEDDSDTDEEVA